MHRAAEAVHPVQERKFIETMGFYANFWFFCLVQKNQFPCVRRRKAFYRKRLRERSDTNIRILKTAAFRRVTENAKGEVYYGT